MNSNILNTPYGMVGMVVIGIILLLLLVMLVKSRKELHTKKALIEEYEEKIKYLRQVGAENEHKRATIEHETEKEMLTLKYKIEGLEKKINEGTKNQVVAMIKAQQNKRARVLQQAGISEES